MGESAGLNHSAQIAAGERFEFGANWNRFLQTLNDNRIQQAEQSMRTLLDCNSLHGKTFLDAGSGSGLFSLAARRLGATVTSFDFDPQSVACTAHLKQRYFPDDLDWQVHEGSVLDKAFLEKLGRHDVVYSWGVLHHTGQMWNAIDNVKTFVADDGKIVISLYNNQGLTSRYWKYVKKSYNSLPGALRYFVVVPTFIQIWGPIAFDDVLHGHSPAYNWRRYHKNRGMSAWHDFIDWIGGLPFEVATPDEVFASFKKDGFTLMDMKTCGGGKGCNEFVFRKSVTT